MKWICLLLVVAQSVIASQGIEYNTSLSQAYDARSILVNPAALGFQTDLNGFNFAYSHAYGLQENLGDEFTSALSLGNFAFSVERQQQPLGAVNRYNLGAGLGLGPYWYGGIRYRFTSSDVAALDARHSLDLGVQVRPDRRLSIGFLAEGVNREPVAGVKPPIQYGVSATTRFFDVLDLSADLYTPGDKFMQKMTAQVLAGWEFYRGARLFAGFHTDRKYQFGLQVNAGILSIFSNGYTGPNNRALSAGFNLSHVPYKSAWMPATVVKVEVDDRLGETPIRGGLLGKDKPSLWQLLDLLNRTAKNPFVELVSIRLDDFPLGYGAAEDLYDAIWKLRDAGKKVDVYLANADLKEYVIASAGTRIILEPTAEVRFTGLRGQRYFFKGIFDKVGLEGEFFAKGEYKSAPESLTRKDSTPLNRNETLRQLKIAESLLTQMIGKGRKFTEREWKLCEKEALIGAVQAKEMGLIDDIAHFEADFDKRTSGMIVRTDVRELSDRLSLPRRVAIVVARGDILKREMKLLSFAGENQITPERLSRSLKRAVGDKYTDAVVLRVSSPGGEVVASDEIAAEVKKTNDVKPVVVTMGDVAASGGYFIAAPATKIFAQPLTITGSIGVFLGKFNFKELYKKIDLNKEVLTHAPYPGLLSEDRPWSEAEKKIMVKRLDEYYAGFVAHVAKYRHLKIDEAEKAAKGRVILGAEATGLKIVDSHTGYLDSVNEAAKLAGLEPGEYVTYVVQDGGGLLDLFGDEGPLAKLPEPAEGLVSNVYRYSLLGSGEYLFWSPYSLLE